MKGRKQSKECNPVLGRIEILAARVAEQSGLELVDVEWKTTDGRPHIVVYIDGKEGISLDHCQDVSKSLGELLDLEDPLPSRYYLEVSSPGLERRLKKASDFKRFEGNNIRVKTYHKINGSRNFRGVLSAFTGNGITIRLENEEELHIEIDDIARANLWYKQEPRR